MGDDPSIHNRTYEVNSTSSTTYVFDPNTEDTLAKTIDSFQSDVIKDENSDDKSQLSFVSAIMEKNSGTKQCLSQIEP